MSADQRPQEFQFDLSGGHLALDFANSISRRDSPEKTHEHLNRYEDLVSFARQTQTLTSDEGNALEREAAAHPRSASHTLNTALALREAIFRAFLALANGKSAPAQDVHFMDKAAQDALRHRHIVRQDGVYRWQGDNNSSLDRLLWPIAQSAAELLTSPELKKVRECQASDCYWLFLDHSRNRSRRWCSMDACGNREKARRHYHRQRAG